MARKKRCGESLCNGSNRMANNELIQLNGAATDLADNKVYIRRLRAVFLDRLDKAKDDGQLISVLANELDKTAYAVRVLPIDREIRTGSLGGAK